MFLLKNLCNRAIFLKVPKSCDNLSVSSRSFVTARSVRNNGTVKLSLIGASLGALVSAGYYLHTANDPKFHVVNHEEKISIIKNVPSVKPSRTVSLKKFLL